MEQSRQSRGTAGGRKKAKEKAKAKAKARARKRGFPLPYLYQNVFTKKLTYVHIDHVKFMYSRGNKFTTYIRLVTTCSPVHTPFESFDHLRAWQRGVEKQILYLHCT